MKENSGIVITLKIRCPCNYNCFYCVAKNTKEKTNFINLDQLEELYKNLDSFIVTELECGGSEPTIHPQIRDLLGMCSKYGIVSLPTNNSLNPKKWLPENNIKRIQVRAALHPEGEKDLNNFLNRIKTISKAGADTLVIYIGHPERFDKIKDLALFFEKENIKISVMPFIGDCNGKKYPESYSDEEFELVKLGNKKIPSWQLLMSLMSIETVIRNFSGIPCLAGYKKMYINEDGGIFRCLYDPVPLGKPLTSSKPCRVQYCGCGLLLEDLSDLDEHFWNYWRKLADLPQLPTSKNRGSTELFLEKKRIYWDLMKRYKKEGVISRIQRKIKWLCGTHQRE